MPDRAVLVWLRDPLPELFSPVAGFGGAVMMLAAELQPGNFGAG
jgi:hypothetical protein